MVTDANDDGEKPDVSERLGDWVQASGRALELRVASAFRRSNRSSEVVESVSYEDPIEKKIREADVVVRYRIERTASGGRLAEPWEVGLTVECKSTGADKPWVIFTEGARPANGADALAMWSVVDAAHAPDVNGKPYGYQIPTNAAFAPVAGTHIATAFIGEQQRAANNARDAASDALRQAVSAAFGVVATHDPDNGSPGALYIGLPIVVTDARLFECNLDNAGHPRFTEVLHSAVVDPTGRGCIVTVLNESYLRQWIRHFELALSGAEESWW